MTALFLQGSTLYQPEPIKERLMEYQKVLKLEIAIVDGKVSLQSLSHGGVVFPILTSTLVLILE